MVVWNEDGTKSFELKQHSGSVNSICWNGVEEKSHLFVTGSKDEVNRFVKFSISKIKLCGAFCSSADRGPSSGTLRIRLRSTFSIFTLMEFGK